VVNQVEVHPFHANEDVRAANRRHGVLTEAWSPIAQGKVVDDDTIGEIASLVGRTPAQVTLRWHVQRGDIVFPKSMNADRMRQNFEIFDVELEPAHMSAIDALDSGEAGRMGPNPDTFDWIP
jgi:2,5-diketo-D-gluconate reductase A